jgi:hypothetical protein
LHILAKIEQSNQDLFERQCACQAGVFSIFNPNAPSGSKDLVNADYIAGVLTGYRTGS